ncbi:NAD(P)H-binding protein [Gemella cuniculi]|uniref:NAD(P)H-binding protein n=1 Tax=Gemella cuniculi TaxID=150240 RepID=UPI0004279552|nr:NAD(P)H-binding protein [Gemella cuniculi]
MKLAITGVTGNFGRAALEYLLKENYSKDNIVLIVRDKSKVKELATQGFDIREGDFNNYKQLLLALQGVEKLLLVSTPEINPVKRIEQHTNAIKAAKEAGVKTIAYTSAINPDKSPLGLAHIKTEEVLKNSGLNYIILRNNYYIEAKESDIQSILEGRTISSNIADGRFGLVLRKEYAQAAVNSLIKDFPVNRVYDLSANVVDYKEFSSSLSKVLDREVKLENITDEEYKNSLEQFLPTEAATLLTQTSVAIRNGAVDVVSEDFEKLLGRPVTNLDDSIRELIKK